MKVAINGLGRIGRLTLRRLVRDEHLELVAVNDVAEPRILAHLVAHDTVHGPAPFPVAWEDGALILDGRRVPCFREPDPARLPFANLGTEAVLECTGRFNSLEGASLHRQAGARRVLLSAPTPDLDSLVLHRATRATNLDGPLLAMASATAQAAAPLLEILDATAGVEEAMATAVHAYTNDQNILDLPHRDLRLARAATMSMIPAPTRAEEELGWAFPALSGRLSVSAVRVPTADVSLLDLGVLLRRESTPHGLNEAFRAAATACPGLLAVAEAELVSPDFVGRSEAAILDPFLTRVMQGRLAKVHAWFDNEAASAARLVDTLRRLA